MKNVSSNPNDHFSVFRLMFVLVVTLMIVVLPHFLMAGQQSGVIKGRVLDAHTGEPLAQANVVLVGTQRGAATDENGYFRIEQVPEGKYQLKAAYIGYEVITEPVTLTAGEEISVDFNLREDFFQTQKIVVTATRSEKLMEDVPVITELISQEEIVEKGANDLSEILEDRPGISIESGTTGGKFLYMNGVDSRRILILVNNVPLAGKLNNRTQLNLIDSDNIEQIEIVKGPGSALYGNDAMGGVINVITRGFTKGLKIEANGRAGSDDLYSGNLYLSGKTGPLGYTVNVDHFQEGFDQGAAEIEIDKTETSSVNGRLKFLNHHLGELELGSEYRRDTQTSESSFMGAMNDNEVQVDHTDVNLCWRKDFDRLLQVHLTSYFSDNFRTYQSARQNSRQPASIDTTTDKIWGVKSDVTLTLIPQIKLDYGFDYSNNDYQNERLPAVQTRHQTGAFTQIETHFIKNLTVTLGGRYDKITDLAGRFSPRFSAMYSLDSGLKFRGSWGGGFRAPSFIELYSDFPIPIPGMPMRVVGNPDLKPEHSLGGNLGVEYLWNSFILMNATIFQNDFKDMIVDYEPRPLTFSYLNVENATFRGLELQTRFYFHPNLTTTLSYNFTDIAQKEEDVAFSKISPHTTAIRINYGHFKNRLKFSLRHQFFSQRDILVVSGHSGSYSKEKKDGYNLLDFTISAQLHPLFAIRVGATNLTNYTDENYGPYIGRRFFVGLNTTFQRE